MNAFITFFYTHFFYFVIYAHIGWLLEVGYAFRHQHKFVNRGFLNGPYCSMYGFAALILTFVLKPFSHNIILLYIVSVFVTSLVEYITGALLERIFHTTWWDYTDDKFNLKGRICLGFSLLWGGAAVLVVKYINPLLAKFLKYILTPMGIIILSTILIILIIDTIFTLISVSNFNKSLDKLKTGFMQLTSKVKLSKNKDMIDSFTKASNKTFENLQKNYSRFIKVFPHLTVNKFKSFGSKVKDFFNK